MCTLSIFGNMTKEGDIHGNPFKYKANKAPDLYSGVVGSIPGPSRIITDAVTRGFYESPREP